MLCTLVQEKTRLIILPDPPQDLSSTAGGRMSKYLFHFNGVRKSYLTFRPRLERHQSNLPSSFFEKGIKSGPRSKIERNFHT